jgi:hypothetical protein
VHLDIETDNVEAEVKRLESLGARIKARIREHVVMVAPPGSFEVRESIGVLALPWLRGADFIDVFDDGDSRQNPLGWFESPRWNEAPSS